MLKKRQTESATAIYRPEKPIKQLDLAKIGGDEETEEERQAKKRLGTSTSFTKRGPGLPSKHNRGTSQYQRLHLENAPLKPADIVARLLEDNGVPDTRNIDPRELDLGRRIEAERGNLDPDDAEKIAFSNLLKDSRFYTNPRR